MTQPRIEMPGGIHHVVGKSPSGRILFRDECDRRRYLLLLAEEVERRDWDVLTYCQLSNHLHMLIRTPEPDLGEGMKAIHERFGRRYNLRHGEWGHVFGRRFYNGLVLSDRHLLGCLRYIARNPVEAGLSATAAGWPWSAHAALAGMREPEPFLRREATYEFISAADYVQLVGRSSAQVLSELQASGDHRWLASAVGDFRIPVSDIASFLGLSRSATYKRIAHSRETQKSVLSVSRETEKSVL